MFNLAENIKKIIVVNKTERTIFFKLLSHSFLIGLANSFFLVQASGNFISKVSLNEIPIAYIFSGIIGLFIVQLFKKIQLKYGNIFSYELIVYFFTLSISIIYINQKYFIKNIFLIKFFAYVGFELIFVFLTLFSLGFNSLCNSNFSFSQSKRLIALLGTGEVIASIYGILIIPILKKYGFENNNILILSIVTALFSLIPISKGQKRNSQQEVSKISQKSKPFNVKYFIKNKYVFFLSITTIISVASYYFVDYSYMVSVRYLSSLTNIEIVNIVAFYLFTSKLGELFFSLFSKNIIYSIGTKTTLLLQPYLLLFFGIFSIICFFIFPSTPVFIVIFLLINKWIGTVIRKNITVPVRKIMLQMNSSEDMNYLQNNIEGLLSQLSTIFCGFLLYLICVYSNVKAYQNFTIIITVINVIIFLLYLISSGKLYKAYQDQIQTYLTNIYKAPNIKIQNITEANTRNNFIAITKDNFYYDKIQSLISNIDFSNKEKMLSLLSYYNLSSKSFFKNINFKDSNSNSKILLELKKLYFSNQNYFNRIVIITYLFNYDLLDKIEFFKEVYNYSDLKLKMYLLDNICSSNDNSIGDHSIFFTEKLNECIADILWTEAAINDLKEDIHEELIEQLNFHRQHLIKMLLNYLELLSDKKTILIVKNIFIKPNKTEDDLIFIVELLENILKPEIKKNVLPIFEPISYISRANKLQTICSYKSLSITNRLIDILMYNFNILDCYTKQLALKLIKSDKSISKIIPAFLNSQIPNLKLIANIDEEKITEEYVDYHKIFVSNEFCKYFSLNKISNSILLRWGFRNLKSDTFKKSENEQDFSFEEYAISSPHPIPSLTNFEIDLIAPLLLSRMSEYFIKN